MILSHRLASPRFYPPLVRLRRLYGPALLLLTAVAMQAANLTPNVWIDPRWNQAGSLYSPGGTAAVTVWLEPHNQVFSGRIKTPWVTPTTANGHAVVKSTQVVDGYNTLKLTWNFDLGVTTPKERVRASWFQLEQPFICNLSGADHLEFKVKPQYGGRHLRVRIVNAADSGNYVCDAAVPTLMAGVWNTVSLALNSPRSKIFLIEFYINSNDGGLQSMMAYNIRDIRFTTGGVVVDDWALPSGTGTLEVDLKDVSGTSLGTTTYSLTENQILGYTSVPIEVKLPSMSGFFSADLTVKQGTTVLGSNTLTFGSSAKWVSPGATVTTNRFGFATHLSLPEEGSVTQIATIMRKGGFNVIRTGAYWEKVQPTSIVWIWNHIDAYMDEIGNFQGMEALLTLSSVPSWAMMSGKNSRPNDLPWANYCAELTYRYPEVRCFEIFNEVNSTTYWKDTANDYYITAMLAADSIHTAGPSALVCNGAFTPASITSGFANDVLSYGLGDYIDCFAMHGYNATVNDAASYVSLLSTYGRGGMPLWSTETAINLYDNNGDFSYTPAAYGQAVAQRLLDDLRVNFDLIIWYEFGNGQFDGNDLRHSSLGLMNYNGYNFAPRSGFMVYHNLVDLVDGYTFGSYTYSAGLNQRKVYKFTDGSTTLLALKANTTANVTIHSTAASVTRFDLYGNESAINLDGSGNALVTLGNEYIYLRASQDITLP